MAIKTKNEKRKTKNHNLKFSASPKISSPKANKLKTAKPDIRYLYDIKNVIYDKKWLKKAENYELYYMYRGLKKKGELRYDITVIPAKMLGKEYVKTKGHYHLGKFGEAYTVLEGQAIYLAQKEPDKSGIIEDVFAVMVKKDQTIIIPSFYGHVTINPSPKKDLKMANWVSKNCKSDYGFYEKMRGASYYYTKTGWIKNKNYKKIPKLRFEKPLNSVPKNLDFLKIG